MRSIKLEFATMVHLSWFCLLILVLVRLEYAVVNGLSKNIDNGTA